MLTIVEGADYVVSDEATTFPSGITSASACLTIQNKVDNFIEDLESYAVTISSNDESVLIFDGTTTVTIIDRSIGWFFGLYFRMHVEALSFSWPIN